MQTETSSPPPAFLAALDLGSNSFHLAIARVMGARLQIVDRLQERVQLAAGLGLDKRLDAESMERALAALQRFGQRLRDFSDLTVRIVGTDTLRVAKNAQEFLERASAILGHPVEVVSGDEEARLIYAGVARGSPHDDGARQLVIDIGGGSTECIIGAGLEAAHTRSLHMGCVSFTRRYFPDGKLTRARFQRAETEAQLLLERLPAPFRRGGWARVYGASGTLLALEAVLDAHGYAPEGGITRDGLTQLRELILRRGHAERLDIAGLKPARAPVITAGLAIARAAFRALPIERMETSSFALREGVLYELLNRFTPGDLLGTSIARLIDRFGIDAEQGLRVATTADALFLRAGWIRGSQDVIRRARQYLGWAARLHEIGLAIAFHGYHKHGAYILEHTPLPGFSRDETNLLSALVLTHRRKISREHFALLPRRLRDDAVKLSVLLRIAVRLHRTRGELVSPPPTLSVDGTCLRLGFAPGFLDAHPLTRADFDDETTRLGELGLRLVVT